MTAWVTCEGCGLKHSARPDGACPRCRGPVGGLGGATGAPFAPETARPVADPGAADAWGMPPTPAPMPYAATPVVEEPSGAGPGLALFIGLAVALLAGWGWSQLAIITGYEVGWIAWGLGAMIGIGVRFMVGGTSENAGLIAMFCSVVSLVFAKVMIVGALGGVVAEELAGDDDAMLVATMFTMSADGEIPANVGELLVANGLDGELSEGAMALGAAHAEAASQRLDGLDPATRTYTARRYAEAVLAHTPWWSRFLLVLSVWDLLWCGLALSSAWKLATGSED